ncbi:MAG: 4Fe-4S dicluster domain-containing protein [Myxococcaceae bacterium]|nr:4Fe-4S dicluster domain-containing protein [Myxococcaceae bacterium]
MTTKPPPAVTWRLPVLDNPVGAPRSHESVYGHAYWRSVEEQRGEGAGPSGEFLPGASLLDAMTRREAMTLLGASAALAGVGCTMKPSDTILPYHQAPEGLTIGNPQQYATAMSVGGVATPLLVTAREGRPVKIEGNPGVPWSGGASGPFEQAELLCLYDPLRLKRFSQNGEPVAKEDALAALTRLTEMASKKNKGAGVRLLLEPNGSPSREALLAALAESLPNAKVLMHAPLYPHARYAGAQLALGRRLEPHYRFQNARVILSLDADFTFPHGPGLRQARAFAESREPGPSMSRLYVVEPSLTITGSMADHRLRMRASDIEAFTRALVALLSRQLPALAQVPGAEATPASPFLEAVAADVVKAGPRAVLVVGDRQPAAVHAFAHAVNGALGSIGETVTFTAPAHTAHVDALQSLVADIERGAAESVIIFGGNPVYSAPAHLGLAASLKKVPTFYGGLYEDETARVSRWVLPASHFLESWGDVRLADGSVALTQPLVEPLYETVSEAQVLGALLGRFAAPAAWSFKESWRQRSTVTGDFEAHFAQWLRAGWVTQSAFSTETPVVNFAAVAEAAKTPAVEGMELALTVDSKVFDGRYAQVPWLQELPDPLTKVVWDNAALVSPKTAEQLGFPKQHFKGTDGYRVPLLRITAHGQSLEVPAFVLPGHADNSVSLALGYGGSSHDKTVAQSVGVNAYRLRATENSWLSPCTVENTGRHHTLVCTQEHWDMHQRDLALQAVRDEATQTLALDTFDHFEGRWKKKPLVEHLQTLKGPQPALYDYAPREVAKTRVEYRWGMAIDLNRCTGCSACVTACYAENNIPTVGKEGVKRNREMAWLRVDRYFIGELDTPGVITQPIPCMQCETAPCEYVCPVNATSHSEEGLNDMVYNRCIGTRYCANNCPYKVRRFNYFHYHQNKTPSERLAMNPEVTVRARGVMEKCTYCVQRIERARIEYRREGQAIPDGAVQTACQQACPTQAIAFGNLNDPQARVSRLHASERRYDLLHDLNTRPRTVYLARVKNPHPGLS